MDNLCGAPRADDSVYAELVKAGLEPKTCAAYGEVKATYYGVIGGFKVTRAWCYWVAKADDYRGLRLDAAQRLDSTPHVGGSYYSGSVGCLGDVIRVGGCAGGQRPSFRVESYHIDTLEGLKAFVAFIKQEEQEGRDTWNRVTPADFELLPGTVLVEPTAEQIVAWGKEGGRYAVTLKEEDSKWVYYFWEHPVTGAWEYLHNSRQSDS